MNCASISKATLLVAALLTPACVPGEVSDADDGGLLPLASLSETVYLDQGWDAATRAAFYQTTQGSRMLPYAWFMNLEVAGKRTRFAAPANMRKMGFLVDGPSASNPDHLPVGFARDEHPTRGAAVGLTCAACHTGEVEVGETKIRIDGGQSMADLEQLQDGLLAALEATLAEAPRFARFADAVLGPEASAADRAALRTAVEAQRDWWSARTTRSRGTSPHGPSRTDAFTIIGNEILCQLLAVPANCAPAVAPTQYPFLWGTTDLDWVQYNSSVHSPIGRNVGEVSGVFAEASLAANGSVVSTANLVNLHRLEGMLTTLAAPAWPEELLGPIDLELAGEGEAIYAAACASCHAEDPQARTAPNAFGRTFARVNFSTPLAALGTDPGAALGFAQRRADPGPWTPIATARGMVGPDGKASAAALLSLSGGMIIQRFFALNMFSDPQKYEYLSYREPLSPTVAQITTYKARSLHGIALTAPYLHNGAVASLHQLLLPPAERMTSFFVGDRQFDPVHVGYVTESTARGVLFDTTLPGNSKAGHVYGTDLDEPQRMALIEYLKTL